MPGSPPASLLCAPHNTHAHPHVPASYPHPLPCSAPHASPPPASCAPHNKAPRPLCQPGELRCTYRAYDAADEVTAAFSLAFDPEGGRLYCGYNRAIRSWDVARPGRDYQTLTTYQKGQEGQPGDLAARNVGF